MNPTVIVEEPKPTLLVP
jgi:hypothetical protein